MLGPEEVDLRFSGMIGGLDARTKVRSLDDLRRRGTITSLRWSGFDIPVILRQFLMDYRSDSWIQYSVTCAVVEAEPSVDSFRPTIDRQALQDRMSEVRQLLSVDLKAIQGLTQRLDALLPQPNAGSASASSQAEFAAAIDQLTTILDDVETRLSLTNTATSVTALTTPTGVLLRAAAHLRSFISSLRAASALIQGED